VKAGTAEQQRKFETAAGRKAKTRFENLARLEAGSRPCLDARGDHIGDRAQAAGVFGASRDLDPGWEVDDGRRGACRERLGAFERKSAQVRVPDCIHDERVRRQRLIRIEIIRINRMNREAAIVDPQPGRDIAAPRRDE